MYFFSKQTKVMKAIRKEDKFERGQFVLKMRGVPFSVKEVKLPTAVSILFRILRIFKILRILLY